MMLRAKRAIDLLASHQQELLEANSDVSSYAHIMRTLFGFIAVAFLLAGCATDVANRYYGSERYPPKDAKEVELLWQRPTREFIVIADFQSRGESPETMRKRAAKIGADAVIVALLGGFVDQSEEWAGDDKQSRTYSRIAGTAIRYR